jgi:RNA polymerase sigma-70 factor (ECF subfamily)
MGENGRFDPWEDPDLRNHCVREARRYVRGAEAEDVVQEALLRAWLKRDEWIAPQAERAWLVQATRWEAIRILKRTQRVMPVDELPADAAAEDRDLSAAPARLDIGRELSVLSPEDRQLLELRYGDDLTQRVIAARLAIPEGTVKVRLHRLRKRLSESLREHRSTTSARSGKPGIRPPGPRDSGEERHW